MKQKSAFGKPEGCTEVLLHACCAPCSSAIVEWLLEHDVRPTIFYYNPNIWPREEYDIRKDESKRHAESLGIRWIDGDYDHALWLDYVRRSAADEQGCPSYDVASEPERGRRCEQCFTLRLTAAARKAQELGIPFFATTLASSRWKSLDQINRAGFLAEETVNRQSSAFQLHFWPQNWRKGGLQERRNQLLHQYDFYNQQYCGCEFSAGQGSSTASLTKPLLRQQMRQAKLQHHDQLAQMSADISHRLLTSYLSPLTSHLSPLTILCYWPLPDEVDIRPLIADLVSAGHHVVLPRVTGDDTMELRRYTSADDLREGAFHIQEPTGALFTDYASVDLALIPGMAFDAAGHRLGRGRGYYDRFLAEHPLSHTIGICFPFQRVPQVPTDAHDIPVHAVV